jgi:histidinol dehydrogenase
MQKMGVNEIYCFGDAQAIAAFAYMKEWMLTVMQLRSV